MLVAGCCFRDEEMRRSVKMNSDYRGTCEASGCEEEVIDLAFFYDFFDEALGLFSPAPGGRPLVRIIQDDWALFASDAIGESILNQVCRDLDIPFNATSTVDYTNDVKRKVSTWDNLKLSVLKEKRFFSDHNDLDSFDFLIPEATLYKNTKLYRARILPKGKTRLRCSEMGCPPRELATAGRANPPGISYLYLCGNEETTYYEVRAVQLDKLSIGCFKVQKDLAIVDFNTEISLYLAFDGGSDLSDIVASKKIISAIREDMSRPMRRYDSELEYIPTQMICEYCKMQGAAGISFDSTMHKGGKNYVLFDSASAKCTKVFCREVTDIEISVTY